MIISAKGRYALRVMVELAKCGSEYASLKEIARQESIPHKFLENIMTELVKAGLVESVRGKNGGYRLTRSPKDYTVADILGVTEAPFAVVGCTAKEFAHNVDDQADEIGCPRASTCPTLPMWKALDETVTAFFEQYTLESLVPR